MAGVPAEVDGGGHFVIRARDFVPAYLNARESGLLKAKIDEALDALGVRTPTRVPGRRACGDSTPAGGRRRPGS
jgi:hypothetical protein